MGRNRRRGPCNRCGGSRYVSDYPREYEGQAFFFVFGWLFPRKQGEAPCPKCNKINWEIWILSILVLVLAFGLWNNRLPSNAEPISSEIGLQVQGTEE